MRPSRATTTASLLAMACLLLLGQLGVAHAASPAPTLSVSPTADIVGSTITVTGSGFPPSTALSLEWASVKAIWDVQAVPTPQVTGINTTAVQILLGSATTNSSGFLSAKISVPSDFGGQHFIQAFLANGTALSAKATFIVEPSFHFSPTSGPDGTPISVTATGLSYGSYSTSYHLSWDNQYVGYMTAVTTQGATNFTFYASGTPGVHYIAVYQGYPGPAYLNPQQGPPSSETQSVFENYIPYYTNFTVTPLQVNPAAASQTTTAAFAQGGAVQLGALALLAGVVGVAIFVSRKDPDERKAISRLVIAGVVIVLVALAGAGVYVASTSTSTSTSSTTSSSSTTSQTSTTSSTASIPQVTFTPVATSYRPAITVPQNSATSGPRITASPDLVIVGQTINVTGQGFAPSAQLPLVWTTRQGSNLLGYKLISKSLRNVTASSTGSFSFTMPVPPDLGGIHYIAAGNLTQNSNATVFIQRSAKLSTTEGPQGTKIQLIMQGVGWDFNTNIVTVDYDNSYIGYACGFNSGGNVTVTIVASGAPGIHTIDVYPSEWWGASDYNAQQIVEYRYPLLTPQDHPELMPSFHFTFLMTSGNATQAAGVGSSALSLLGGASILTAAGAVGGLAVLYTAGPMTLTNPSGRARLVTRRVQ